MKLRLPSKLVAAIMAAASTTVLTTLCTGSSAYAEGEAPAAVKNGETLGNVMYIGDSITNGHGGMVSWRWPFFKILTDNGISQTEQGINTGRNAGSGSSSYHRTEFTKQTYGGVTFENIHTGYSSGRAWEIAGRQTSYAFGRYDCTNIKNWLGADSAANGNSSTNTVLVTDGDYTGPVYSAENGNAIDNFFLLIGTNDFLSDSQGGVPAAQVTQNLLGWDGSSFTGHIYNGTTKPDIEVIYDTMRNQAPQAKITMLTLPTVAQGTGVATPQHIADIKAYNAVLTDWVTRKNAEDGDHITLIDVNKGLVDIANTVDNKGVTGFFNDGLHPSAQGELIIAGNVAKGMGIGGRTAGLVRSSAATDTALWTSAAETSYTLSSGTLNFAENAFTTENGYTVDFGAVFGDGAANTWLDSSNALSITIGDGSNTGTLNISEGYIMWGSNILYSQDNHSNTENLRIAYHNGVTADNVAAGYYVWLGDMLIGEGLTATTGSGLLNGITLGATGAEGTVSNLTWTDTAYAPTTNFYMNEAAAYTAVQEVTRAISVAAGATENINVETIASSFSMGANSTLNIGKNVTVQSGAQISVTDSMHLTIAEGAKLTLTGTDVGSDDYTKSTKFAYIMDAATGDGTIQLNGDTYVQLGNNASPFSTPHVFKTNYHVTGDMALQDWKHTDNGTADNDNPWVIGNAENQGSLTVDGKLWVSNGQHLEVSENGSLNVTGNVELGLVSTWHYTGYLDVLGGEATLGSIKFLSNNAAFNMSGGVLRVTGSNAFDAASVANTTATTISAGTLKAEGNSWVFNRTATIGGADSTVTVVTDATHSITLGANGTTTTLAGDINVGAPGIAMMSEDGAGSSAQSGNLVLDGAYNGGAHAVNVLSGSSLAFGNNFAVNDGSTVTVNVEEGWRVQLKSGSVTLPQNVVLNTENKAGIVALSGTISTISLPTFSLGDENTAVELNGVTGKLESGTISRNIVIGADGLSLNDGTGSTAARFEGSLSGTGDITRTNAGGNEDNITFAGDVSGFTGNIIYNRCNTINLNIRFEGDAKLINAATIKTEWAAYGSLNLILAAEDAVVNSAIDNSLGWSGHNWLNVLVEKNATFNKTVKAFNLTVSEGSTATFKEALTLTGALAIGAAASGDTPATTATVNIGEGAEIILHGGSITAGSTLNNAGTMVFESTSNAGNVDLFKAATGTGNAVIKTNMAVGNDVQLGLTGNLTVTNGATLGLATAKAQPTKLGWTSGSENKGFSSVTLAGGIISSDSTLGIVRNLTTTENTTGNKIHFRDFPDSPGSFADYPTNFSGTTTLNSALEIYTEYKSQLQFDHLTGSGNLSLTATANRSDSGANVTINSVDGYTGTLNLLGSVPNNNKVKVTLDTRMNNTFTGIQLQNAELILVSRNDAAQRVHNLGAVTVTKASTIESAASQFHSQVDIASLTGSADLNLVQSSKVDHASVFNINGGDAGTYSGTLHIKQNVADGHRNGRHAILNIKDADVLSNAVISLGAVNNNDSRVGLGIDADSVTVKGITTADAYGEKIIFSGAGTVDTTGKNSAVYNGDGTVRTLIINTGNNAETTYTANAVVKGNLNITKNGAGTQSFTGNVSAFNGSLTVTAGTLSFTNAVTVAAERTVTMEGGTLTFGNGATISGATTLAGTSLLNFTGGSSTMTGAITAANTSTVALSNSASLTIKGAADKALGKVTLNNGTLNLWSESAAHILTLNSLAVTGENNVIAAAQSGYHGQVDIANLSSTAAGASLEFKNAMVDRASVLNINGGEAGAFDGTLHLHQIIGTGTRHIAMNVADADVLSKAVISMESEDNSTAHVALGIAGDSVTVKGITTDSSAAEKVIFSGTAALGAGVKPGTTTQNPDAYNGDGTTRTLVINTAGGNYTANATVKGNLNLTKNGSGSQTFSGDVSAFNGKINVTNGTLAFTGLTSDNTLSIGSNLTTDEGNAKVSGSGALVAGKATFTAKGEAATMDAEGDAPATNTGTIANAVFTDSSLSGTLGKGSLSNGLLAIAEDVTYSISEMTLNNSVVDATANGAVLNMQNVSIDAASGVEANSGALTGSNRLTLSAGETTKDITADGTISSSQLTGLTLNGNLTIDLSEHDYAHGVSDKSKFSIVLSDFTWQDLIDANRESYDAAAYKTDTGKTLDNVFKVIAVGGNADVLHVLSVSNFESGIKIEVQVPEPTTSVLSLLALAGLAARRRRK